MRFYTNVSRYGSSILYRGYDNGRRVQEKVRFKPTLFLPSRHEKTIWTALDGTPVEPKKFDSISEASDFVKTYENVESFKIFGNTRWVAQFIQEKFPDEIPFDRTAINVLNMDIEVISIDGFPEPEQALHPVTTICVKSSREDCYRVWGTKPYDPALSTIKVQVEYHQFRTEEEMLKGFISWWSQSINTPDIVTGWNSRLFDIPYLANRINRLFGAEVVARLSPWNKVEAKDMMIKGRKMQFFDITGISQLDYLDLFKKFTTHTYGNQESYKLNHIAHVVLDDEKVNYEEFGSLAELYDKDYQKFVDYNIKDVQIVDRFEDKLGLITLALTLAYIGGVNYNDTLGTTAIWDSIIYRDLSRKAIAVPPSRENFKGDYPGGYVKEVKAGQYDWVCSFDLNSLYPNLIIQYNMSPETILPMATPGVSPDVILNGQRVDPVINSIMAANGVHFKSERQGVIPRIINQIYDQRVTLKKAMISEKKRLETIDKSDKVERYKCEREISRLENHQIAVKILLNSLYGALGNAYFRYFDLRVAEGVTLSGQLAIRWAEKAVNGMLNDFLQTKGVDYVIAIDTDSVYVSMADVVKKFNPKNPVKFLDEFCAKMVEPTFGKAYDDLSKIMKCPTNRMGMKREAISDRGIWVAKKCYILNVHNNEGVQYKEPKIKIMGIAAVKSSTPEVCRDEMEDMFRVIIREGQAAAQKKISDFRERFDKMSAEDIAFPRGVSDVKSYAAASTIYSKGSPIHVRASLLFNHHVKRNGLDSKYELINNGEKIKYLHLKLPNPINENVIGFMTVLPTELGLHNYIDYDTQFQKTFLDPIDTIFEAIGWNTKDVSTLESFFGN